MHCNNLPSKQGAWRIKITASVTLPEIGLSVISCTASLRVHADTLYMQYHDLLHTHTTERGSEGGRLVYLRWKKMLNHCLYLLEMSSLPHLILIRILWDEKNLHNFVSADSFSLRVRLTESPRLI